MTAVGLRGAEVARVVAELPPPRTLKPAAAGVCIRDFLCQFATSAKYSLSFSKLEKGQKRGRAKSLLLDLNSDSCYLKVV